MREAPQGHRREPFLRDFLGEQKVPRRRQNARRARKRGPQAQEKTTPEGRKEPFQKTARAAGPKRTTPGGQREMFQRKARAAWPIKTFSVKRARAAGPEKNNVWRVKGGELLCSFSQGKSLWPCLLRKVGMSYWSSSKGNASLEV